MHEIIGYSYPNDVHIHWTLMIVMYPYVTGLVAGAFILGSFYHVFDREEFKPVARLCLAVSFSFLMVATLPLLNHLGQPQRSFYMFITSNFSSAMAGFGYIYLTYLIILSLEVWLVFREDIILLARRSRGLTRMMYKALSLWTYDTSPEALAIDHKVTKVLSAIGIPAACILHGYVGFIFGALKANPWWSTPLMPVIFLFSAIVSGIAGIIIIYQVAMKFSGRKIDREAISGMTRWLWLFLMMASTLEILEIVVLAYEGAEEWEIIEPLLTEQLAVSFIGIQLILGSLVPFILLMISVLLNRHFDDRVANTLAFVASFLLLLQVFAMRWNVVIGGQLFSKSLRGIREGYSPHFLEKEGIGAALAIFILPFIIMLVFNKILPIFRPQRGEEAASEA
ncbi:MAG: polysulfide reductase NrfD [Deltaproteobacteria bacterium]|nr:polysulfide reductase NrfD [Deltaproteobacteria bacterium]